MVYEYMDNGYLPMSGREERVDNGYQPVSEREERVDTYLYAREREDRLDN